MTTATVLKKVAREIRYRSLPDLISQPVKIHSWETIEIDIRQALGVLWPNECHLVSKASELAIIKYGIIDLTFSLPKSVLADEYESGISLLKRLQFVSEPETAQKMMQDSEFTFTDDPLWLSELADDIAKNSTFLKLFLCGEKGRLVRNLMGKLELSSNYFPQIFTITDACFTNAGSVWFLVHFYM